MAWAQARLKLPLAEVVAMAAGIERVNEELLGPRAASNPSANVATPRIPARLLRDVSAGGALEVAVRCVVARRLASAFIEDGSSCSDEARRGALEAVRGGLVEAGWLRSKVLHFDATVPTEVRTDLAAVAMGRLGALVVSDPSIKAITHVVRWDPDVDGAVEDVSADEYLRTLVVDEARSLALVHWWYAPDSRDEWINIGRVRGGAHIDLDKDPEAWAKPVVHPGKKNKKNHAPDNDDDDEKNGGGPWRVCCRFVRDAAKHNEWGCELDYVDEDDDGDDNDNEHNPLITSSAAPTTTQQGASKRKRSAAATTATSISGSRNGDDVAANNNNININKAPSRPRTKGRSGARQSAARLAPSVDEGAESIRASRDVVVASLDASDSAVNLSLETTPSLNNTTKLKETEAGPAAALAEEEERRRRPNQPVKAEAAEAGRSAEAATVSSSCDGGALSNAEAQQRAPSFDASGVNSLERACCPEWFCGDGAKSPENYIEARNWMIAQSNARPTTLLTATFCRQRLSLDACATTRLFNFVDAWGLVNAHVPPTARRVPKPRPRPPPFFVGAAKGDDGRKKHTAWSEAQLTALCQAAAAHRDDWTEVAATVNRECASAFDAIDCAERFVDLPLRDLDHLEPLHQLKSSSARHHHHHHAPTTANNNNHHHHHHHHHHNGASSSLSSSLPTKNGASSLDAQIEARLARLEKRFETFHQLETTLDVERRVSQRERARLKAEWADLALGLHQG